MKTFCISTCLTLLLVVQLLQAKPIEIAGKVTSAIDGKPMSGVAVKIKGTSRGTITGLNGKYHMSVPSDNSVLSFSYAGYTTQHVRIGGKRVINVRLSLTKLPMEEVEDIEAERLAPAPTTRGKRIYNKAEMMNDRANKAVIGRPGVYQMPIGEYPPHNTEEYDAIHENIFLETSRNPLSTFSIDVDAASYSNIRRFINRGQQPPKDAVRIEEMVNYFTYDYAQPKGGAPFAIHTEVSSAPWNPKHRLVHIGLQGKKIPTANLPASNLVFLLDVSGSMSSPNKLPLLKSAFQLLVEELRPIDRVSIVVYAGAAGLVLPPTSGDQKETILAALNNLSAGGSTAGGAGIRLAYKVAMENFQEEGNNRVILATDGDFNIGESSNAAMERLVAQQRDKGVFLTALGFGMGNYKDSKMETIADKGNGNYAYIDNILEAKKVLVNEFGGTLFTIAKDVKLQVEFNPAKVKGYRLIGYENRALKNEDFNNDKKDAGDLGAGHTVTALYEVIPVGVDSEFLSIDPLKYQKQKTKAVAHGYDELMTVKFRYKAPEGKVSKLITTPISDHGVSLAKSSNNFRWSAAVASFGMLLRDSEFKGSTTLESVLRLAEGARGKDAEGYRAEFIKMVGTMNIYARE